MTDLPDELAAFEAELQALPRRRMPNGLRQRVLSYLQAELARQATATLSSPSREDSQHSSARWWFAATAAAAALLWLNLSWMAARTAGLAWQPVPSHTSRTTIEETQATITALLPELSPGDSQRFALILSSSKQTTRLPDPAAAVPTSQRPESKAP